MYTVVLYSMYSWWRGGGVTEKIYLYLGGVMEKNVMTGAGVMQFLMTVQKIPPAPLTRKKWTVPYLYILAESEG